MVFVGLAHAHTKHEDGEMQLHKKKLGQFNSKSNACTRIFLCVDFYSLTALEIDQMPLI